MKENILVKSQSYNVIKLLVAMVIAGAVLSLALLGYFVAWTMQYVRDFGEALHSTLFEGDLGLYCVIPVAVLSVLGVFVYLWLRSYELTVTDKRVYGKVMFGKRVDLPIDSVSATGTVALFKGVSVSTSSGRISFLAIKNAEEIYAVVSKLLIERQQGKQETAPTGGDEAEQLKKFKKLLDDGVITQEEFDAKKKQILGL